MPAEQACGNSHKCFYQNGVEFINHARLRRSHVGKASRSMAKPTKVRSAIHEGQGSCDFSQGMGEWTAEPTCGVNLFFRKFTFL